MVDALNRVLRSSGALLIRWFCVFAAIFVSGALGSSLPSVGSRISLFLLPSGFAVAAHVPLGLAHVAGGAAGRPGDRSVAAATAVRQLRQRRRPRCLVRAHLVAARTLRFRPYVLPRPRRAAVHRRGRDRDDARACVRLCRVLSLGRDLDLRCRELDALVGQHHDRSSAGRAGIRRRESGQFLAAQGAPLRGAGLDSRPHRVLRAHRPRARRVFAAGGGARRPGSHGGGHHALRPRAIGLRSVRPLPDHHAELRVPHRRVRSAQRAAGSRHRVDVRRRPQFRLSEHHGAAHAARRCGAGAAAGRAPLCGDLRGQPAADLGASAQHPALSHGQRGGAAPVWMEPRADAVHERHGTHAAGRAAAGGARANRRGKSRRAARDAACHARRPDPRRRGLQPRDRFRAASRPSSCSRWT